MDDPIQDSPHVVEVLTQGSPKEQEQAINTYFTPDASFTHPFCRTGSFEGSRHLLHGIYRWYKILSPTIHLNVNSVGKLALLSSKSESERVSNNRASNSLR